MCLEWMRDCAPYARSCVQNFSYSTMVAINNCLNSRYREPTPWEMHPGMVSSQLPYLFATAPVVPKRCEPPARSRRNYGRLHTHVPICEAGPLDQGSDDHVMAPTVGHSSAS